MSDQISNIPEVLTRACADHGEYEIQVVEMKFGKAMIFDKCPTCAEELATENEREYRERSERQAIEERSRKILSAGVPERFKNASFDTYECKTPEQAEILGKIKEYRAAIPTTEKSLMICGFVGTGKTHLGCALLISLIDSSVFGFPCRYTSALRMVREIRTAYKPDSKESEQDLIDLFSHYQFLVIDEIGVQFGTVAEKNLLFEVMNGRYENMWPTVLMSNLDMKEVTEYLGDRVVDRLRETGDVLTMTWESYRKTKGKT